jgi:hypothetical protein
MKNLLIIHLESLSMQTFGTFNHVFPAINQLFRRSIRFDKFFSSATSSLMAIAAVWHGNSFEFDHSTTLANVKPAGLNRNLYSVLKENGYHTHALCLNTNHLTSGTDISIWPRDLEPVWGTDSPEDLILHFDTLTNERPFALYFWNLLTHISNQTDQTKSFESLAEQLERKYQLTDFLVGSILNILENKDLLNETLIVVFGDHGDDFWTHGFKGGYVHATEPYTNIIATPMCIFSPERAPFRYANPSSTIDIRNTVLSLLGVAVDNDHPCSGIDLFSETNEVVFSQCLLANQSFNQAFKVYKAYAAINDSHILLATKEGLELYNYLLDPSNGCNLLHLFSLRKDGRLRWKHTESTNDHIGDIYLRNPQNLRHLHENFATLREALCSLVEQKNSFTQNEKFPLASLGRINRKGYVDFYEHKEGKYRKESMRRRAQLYRERLLDE